MSPFLPGVAETFRDPAVEAEFRAIGFIVVGPVLEPDEVTVVRAASQAMAVPGEGGMIIDYMRDDRSRIHELRELIAPKVQQRLPQYFADHRLVVPTVITKYPGEDSALLLHEDRTHVDEREFRAGNLWIPLVDVGPGTGNGALEIVPRSHLLSDIGVGTRTPDLWRPYERFLHGLGVVPVLPAGWGVFYDNTTLHASPPNRTDEPREAIACLIVPRQAELVHVVATGRRHRSYYRIDDDFLFDIHPHLITPKLMEGYELLSARDEDVRLAPQRLIDVLVPDDPDVSVADVVPPLRDAPPGISYLPRRLPLWNADIPASAVDRVAPDVVDAVGLTVTTREGRAGIVVLTDGHSVCAPLPEWAGALEGFIDPSRCQAVLVIERAGLVDVRFDQTRVAAWELEVIDASQESSWLGVGEVEEDLDESRRLVVTRASGSMWNHGPGVGAYFLDAAMRVKLVEPAEPSTSAPAPADGPDGHASLGDVSSAPAPRPLGGAILRVRTVVGRGRRWLRRRVGHPIR